VKFPYRQEPSTPGPAHQNRTTVLRPRIRVRLFHEDRFIDLLALVDSGADDCLFPLEVATELGLPFKHKNENRYGGIGTGHITAVFTHVKINFAGEVAFPLYAGFSDAPSAVPILGQGGFFDRFDVTFRKRKKVIELKFTDPDPASFLLRS
jgi:hypothetical protein